MTSLKSYVSRRILQAIFIIFCIIALNFIIINLAPGDPITYFIGEATPSEEYIESLKARFGLDQPLPIRLMLYIKSVMMGDLGFSYIRGAPVLTLVFGRLPATLLLMGTAIIFSSIVGIILGVLSSRKPYSLTDNLVQILSSAGYALPSLWLGLILLLIFSLWLGLFPVSGMRSLGLETTGIQHVLDVLHHLILPALTIGLYSLAVTTRLTRASMLDILGRDFIITAKAKGLGEKIVLYKHALRNALSPIVTMIGMQIGSIFAGAAVTETVFGWPGLGTLLYESILQRDYPLIMGTLLVVSVTAITMNLIVDILYGFLDPRIRYK